jgi:vitamin B12 transporter
MKQHSLALAISVACAATPAFAEQQNQEDQIEKLVVVSSRIAMPMREIATSVSLITKADIDARGYANLADVLKTQPSIGVTSSGGIGSTTTLRVRGEEGYRTLVRIDGVDISDPTGTQIQAQLGHLQSANISRVEILRGSQGLAYGADAGGVINITSGSPTDELSGNVTADFGRYDTRNIAANVGASNEDFDYYIAASDYKTNGFNSRVDDTSQDKDGYENNTVHARLGVQLTNDLTFGLVLRNNDGQGQFDHCGFGASASDNCSSEFSQTNVRGDLNYVSAHSEHELAYAKTFVERENFNQGSSSYLTKGTLERVEYLGQSELSADSRVIYGLDWKKESITSADQSRNNIGYYAEYQSELVDNLYFTGGLRYDDNDDFGQHTSFRLSSAYIWAVNDDELKLRGAYGTGFRAPSLYEVEYNRGPWAYAPASTTNLKEETTQGYEVALEYRTANNSHFEVVYFNQEIDDSIYFDLATFSGYLQDLGQSSSEGVELIANWQLSEAFVFHGNYTYNETEDTAGEQRSRRPRHIANIGADYQINRFTVSANVRLVKDFVDNGVALDDYEVLDLSARYQVTDNLTTFARVENLFDSQYQDIASFNTSGEAFHLGLNYQF